MCGIVGIWGIDGQRLEKAVLGRFTDSLAHRGPDGKGIFIDSMNNFGLGHRRLSVLDITELGNQPMAYADNRYQISFNGEIYNFLELRNELKKLGHVFRSETDTEVVLAAYAEWGEDCQYKFNGMWAFALWDSKEKILFLSRDRFGVKPLFFLHKDKRFLFASELKAFMALPKELRPDFDLTMVARMKNEESTDQTLLKNVRNLNGGCCLTLKQGSAARIRRWWNTADHLEEVPRTFGEQVECYREIFYDACRIRMRSDVPIGTALSGGLDSSSVLCMMSQIRNESVGEQRLASDWQNAFVLGYANTSHDERPYAEQVVKHAGVTAIYKEIHPNFISPDDLESAIFGFEAIQNAEPSIGPWLIYREMKSAGVPVSMDGLGGDETLAGYHEYLPVAMKDAVWPVPNLARWRELQMILAGLYDSGVSEGAAANVPTFSDVLKSFIPKISNGRAALVRYLEKSPRLENSVRNYYRLGKRAIGELHGKPHQPWLQMQPATPTSNFRDSRSHGRDYLQRYLYADFHYGTNARSLRNFDRMSMAHGIESRAPFMDWRLVCFSFSLPQESKLGGVFTKRILREAMRGVIPENIRTRTGKLGFASPMSVWYRYSMKHLVLDTLNNKRFLESDIWNGSAILDFTERCFKREDYNSAVRSWRYIQAFFLMDSFQKAARAGDLVR